MHMGIDDEPSWDRQTSRHANKQFDPRMLEIESRTITDTMLT